MEADKNNDMNYLLHVELRCLINRIMNIANYELDFNEQSISLIANAVKKISNNEVDSLLDKLD